MNIYEKIRARREELKLTIEDVNNGESADKYYTQIIELYNLWKDRYIEDQERIKEEEEKTRSKRVNAESKL